MQRTKGFDACNECSSPKKSVRAAQVRYSVRSLAYCSHVESSGFGAVAAHGRWGKRKTHRFQVTGLHGLHCNPSEAVEKRARKTFAATTFAHGVLGSKDAE